MFKIEWSEEAFEDFQYYINWYTQNRGISISNSFESTILLSLETLRNNPYIARPSFEILDLIEYIIQKYPFLISYYIKNEHTISITSFLHQSRKR